MAVWVVKAGEGSEVVDQVESADVVAIGWQEMGDCSDLQTREDFKRVYREAYPEDTSASRIGLQAGQVYRFVREVSEGDIVMTPDSPQRELLMGRIAGDYRYDPNAIGERYPQVRPVEWVRRISRDDLTPGLASVVTSWLTIFAVEGWDSEVETLLAGETPEPDEPEDLPDLYQETVAKADELISDILARIGPYEFQDLVAAVLRAMGLRTTVSPPGPDGGKDIVAHPDAFGFSEPVIKVQVKHTKGSMSAPDVRSFRSVVGQHEKGLIVSTGGYTSEAMREPEKAGTPLTLMDRDQFVDLLTEHYEKMEPEYQAMIPLKKVYIPVVGGLRSEER
jgi:restriction system protein